MNRPPERSGPIKIIGHFGYLDRTGGTYGLKYLLVDLLPVLEKEMAGLDYEVHVIGRGDMAESLLEKLKQKHMVVRGFVPDLDAELLSCDVVLMLNNSGPYVAAFTRHAVCWSLGLCLVAHERSQLAIPEIRHMENALLGDRPEEIAKLIRLAVTDRDLNERLGRGGRNTYEAYFKPELVAQTLQSEIFASVSQKPS